MLFRSDVKLIELNYKVMNCLYCAFDSKEFDEISSCNSAKEIHWRSCGSNASWIYMEVLVLFERFT